MNQKIKIIACMLLLIIAGNNPMQSQEVNAKKIILSHIGDSYQWHITKWGHTDIAIPLPVILISKTGGGFSIFMSSKLDEGETYKNYKIASDGKYSDKIVEVNAAGAESRPLDFSLTKNALALLINCTILVLIIMYVARWYKKQPLAAPKGLVGAMEIFIMDIHDSVIKNVIGKGYEKYAPYLLTAFFFIFVNNVMGIIPIFPGGASTTGNIAVTVVLALCTFFVVSISGTKHYWIDKIWPDVPIWLKIPIPIFPITEIFGIFSKPFALMIRLFANVMAGHAIILTLTCLIFITVAKGPAINTGMTILSVAMAIFMSLLELLIAYIQAYVFTLLSAVFITLAREEKVKEVEVN